MRYSRSPVVRSPERLRRCGAGWSVSRAGKPSTGTNVALLSDYRCLRLLGVIRKDPVFSADIRARCRIYGLFTDFELFEVSARTSGFLIIRKHDRRSGDLAFCFSFFKILFSSDHFSHSADAGMQAAISVARTAVPKTLPTNRRPVC